MALAEQQTDGWCVGYSAKEVIHRRQIKIELTCPFRLKLACLELDDKVAVEPDMIEEQVDIESLVADLERYLAANKGEAPAQFEKQIAKMDEETRSISRSCASPATVRKSKL